MHFVPSNKLAPHLPSSEPVLASEDALMLDAKRYLYLHRVPPAKRWTVVMFSSYHSRSLSFFSTLSFGHNLGYEDSFLPVFVVGCEKELDPLRKSCIRTVPALSSRFT